MKVAKTTPALLVSAVFLAVLSGCAGTRPIAEFRKPIKDVHRLCVADDATVRLAASESVTMNDVYRQRLESRLQQTINDKKKAAQCQTADKRAFVLNSTITRYDEGSAFARALLAGLGQMHIDGEFALSLPGEPESVAEFSLRKTFAWGGVYGASTRIEDIEPAFAEAVAEAIVVPVPEKKDSDRPE